MISVALRPRYGIKQTLAYNKFCLLGQGHFMLKETYKKVSLKGVFLKKKKKI